MEKNIKHKITGLILPSPRTNRGKTLFKSYRSTFDYRYFKK
jgi:hypothetical protein